MAVKFLSIKFVKFLAIFSAALILLTIILVIYFPGYAKLKELRNENKRIISENERLKREIADYEKNIQEVHEDYLKERIARDDLGIAKDNEIVIDIER